MQELQEFPHIIHMPEKYPHFDRSLFGLKDRFEKITGTSKEFRNREIEKKLGDLVSSLKRPLQVIIVSKQYVELERCVNLDTKNKEELVNTEIQVDPCITIVLGYVKVDDYEEGKEEVLAVYNYLMSPQIKEKTSLDNIYLICEMNSSFTQENTDKFSADIKRMTPDFKADVPYDHVIVAMCDNVSCNKIISKNLQYKVMKILGEAKEFLKSFIRYKRPNSSTTKCGIQKEICNVIELNWPLSSTKFVEKIQKLLETIEETIIRGVSDYYMVSRAVCKTMFKDSDFVDKLMPFLNHTNIIQPEKEKRQDDLMEMIKKNAIECLEALLKRLCRVEMIIKKFRLMVIELDSRIQRSYLCSYYQKEHVEKISEALRQDLCKIQGVTSVGRIAGDLEIHVNSDQLIEDVSSKVLDCVENHKYKSVYHVKHFSQLNAKQTAATIVVGGCKIINGNHFATLGLVAKGSDGKLYGLTSGHFAKCSFFCEKVFLSGSSEEKQLIGYAEPAMYVMSKNIDIAAIRLENKEILLGVQDKDGMQRNARIFDGNTEDLENSLVYKYGAGSGLTEGIITSSDYGDGFHTAILISSLSGEENNPFAVDGDSGSVNCIEVVDEDTVEVVSMNVGMMTVSGEENLSVSYLLENNLKAIEQKTGIQFSL